VSQSIGGHTPTLHLYNSLNWPSYNAQTLALHHTNKQSLPFIVIATDTLSVGVDIPDINNVILWGEPKESDEFLQKLGHPRCQLAHTSNPHCIIYISRSTMATAQKMVDAEAEVSWHKKYGSGDEGMDISAAELITTQCKSQIIDWLYNNPVTDVPCKCEGCRDCQEHCSTTHHGIVITSYFTHTAMSYFSFYMIDRFSLRTCDNEQKRSTCHTRTRHHQIREMRARTARMMS
jgi:hypothetical protein